MRHLLFAILLAGVAFGPLPASAGPVEAAARIFAKSSVDAGSAIGVGVGIVIKGEPPRFFSYGLANAGKREPFGPDSLFEIGSVTKIFTTNLLGQAVHDGKFSLNTPLLALRLELGSLKPLMGQATLKDLGDFTAGLPSLAPLCQHDNVPGCLPSDRPAPAVYNAQKFLAFFQNTVPKNYQLAKPEPVTSLPAPYYYSDFSVGLLGLILGGSPNTPLSNAALGGWVKLLRERLLRPLGMRNTYLFPPSQSPVPLALGYNQAIGSAIVASGQVRAIALEAPGSGYTAPPKVTIKGGGGTGARATAQIGSNGSVTGFTVTNGGYGYVPPPAVTFLPSQARAPSGSPPKAIAVVAKGKVAGVKIIDGGSGYTQPPNVVISGGRRNGLGRDAKCTAHIANGSVSFVSVDDGGEGYIDPVTVSVAPGNAITNPVPIWAPAGALHSTIRDMSILAAAATGLPLPPASVITPAIAAGFNIAETPYACTGPLPNLPRCPAGSLLSGLSWAIQPEDKVNKVPAIVMKNGGLSGFSTQVMLMPARGLAVVVFVNSNGATSAGEKEGEAERIARNILYALYYTLPPAGPHSD
ncbi:MAG TPA: serine hydrolase [Methylocella sp.]|nr:serine hydrolase [Methylocella sp.]